MMTMVTKIGSFPSGDKNNNENVSVENDGDENSVNMLSSLTL